MNSAIFFIDFDGVICDSINECLLSSYNAYHSIIGSGKRLEKIIDLNNGFYSKFFSLRPFVRSGEDYLLIIEMIEKDQMVYHQNDFDEVRIQNGDTLSKYKEALYQERNRMIQDDKELWLGLNPLYSLVNGVEIFRTGDHNEDKYILTTKRKDYVMDILKHHKIIFPEEKIIHVSAEEKIGTMNEIINRNKFDTGNVSFVDDQILYLLQAKELGVKVFLADWGYTDEIQKKIARENEIPVINKKIFHNLLISS